MLLDRLKDDLKTAQLGRDEVKVSTLRLLLSEIKNAQIAKGGEVDDGDVIALVQREVKKRKEAVVSFRSGQREDLVSKEEAEEKILVEYLPAQLSNEELTKLILDTINEVGAKSIQDIGKVMRVVMSKVAGRVDGGTVSNLVREILG
ncbi:GatB/YqeY domain-containing protein [Candidatus Daviesbacteria bacterium]|nr:GatB/YqeY domain-containing protein [Candidatus Daviesbacteria bacterium]